MKKYFWLVLLLSFILSCNNSVEPVQNNTFMWGSPTTRDNTVVWDFTDSTGYILENTVLNDDAARGFVLQVGSNTVSDELDDADFTNWYDHSSLSQDTDTRKFGTSSAKIQSNGNDTSSEDFWGGYSNGGSHCEFWFYDDGAVASPVLRCIVLSRDGAAPPFAIVTGIGIDQDVSLTNYVWYNPATTNWEDTGILRNQDWHTFRYAFWQQIYMPTLYYYTKVWLDDLRLVNREGVTDNGGYSRVKTLNTDTSELSKPLWIDRIRGSKTGGIYRNSGTVIPPKAQPGAVQGWLHIVLQSNHEFYRGDTFCEFQWSSDGGDTWNGTWLEASDDNLQAVPCDGDGQDAAEFLITMYQHPDKVHTPRVESLSLFYE